MRNEDSGDDSSDVAEPEEAEPQESTQEDPEYEYPSAQPEYSASNPTPNGFGLPALLELWLQISLSQILILHQQILGYKRERQQREGTSTTSTAFLYYMPPLTRSQTRLIEEAAPPQPSDRPPTPPPDNLVERVMSPRPPRALSSTLFTAPTFRSFSSPTTPSTTSPRPPTPAPFATAERPHPPAPNLVQHHNAEVYLTSAATNLVTDPGPEDEVPFPNYLPAFDTIVEGCSHVQTEAREKRRLHTRPIALCTAQGFLLDKNSVEEIGTRQEYLCLNSYLMVQNPEADRYSYQRGHAMILFYPDTDASPIAPRAAINQRISYTFERRSLPSSELSYPSSDSSDADSDVPEVHGGHIIDQLRVECPCPHARLNSGEIMDCRHCNFHELGLMPVAGQVLEHGEIDEEMPELVPVSPSESGSSMSLSSDGDSTSGTIADDECDELNESDVDDVPAPPMDIVAPTPIRSNITSILGPENTVLPGPLSLTPPPPPITPLTAKPDSTNPVPLLSKAFRLPAFKAVVGRGRNGRMKRRMRNPTQSERRTAEMNLEELQLLLPRPDVGRPAFMVTDSEPTIDTWYLCSIFRKDHELFHETMYGMIDERAEHSLHPVTDHTAATRLAAAKYYDDPQNCFRLSNKLEYRKAIMQSRPVPSTTFPDDFDLEQWYRDNRYTAIPSSMAGHFRVRMQYLHFIMQLLYCAMVFLSEYFLYREAEHLFRVRYHAFKVNPAVVVDRFAPFLGNKLFKYEHRVWMCTAWEVLLHLGEPDIAATIQNILVTQFLDNGALKNLHHLYLIPELPYRLPGTVPISWDQVMERNEIPTDLLARIKPICNTTIEFPAAKKEFEVGSSTSSGSSSDDNKPLTIDPALFGLPSALGDNSSDSSASTPASSGKSATYNAQFPAPEIAVL
ncbi:hypothetical protein V5O48_015167 [Marasmius crinis-equi]|uniref:Uncharacterized protein n=1 Tax=Marasmius crinis-equi TaxID=585013 RepID=A0ABR3EVA9_9AGAR